MTILNLKAFQGIHAAAQLPKCVSLRIGDITVEIRAVADDMTLKVDHEMQMFLAQDLKHPDIRITAEWCSGIGADTGTPLFDTDSIWRVFATGQGGMKFEFATPALGEEPYKTAHVDAGIKNVKVFLNRKYFTPEMAQSPLEYPLDELLYIHKLAKEGWGVEVHGCGVVGKDGKGRLFVGHSGAGKSTTSELWKAVGALVLSDDRIILRMDGGKLRMHGTPWHGDAGFAAQASAQVDAIFFLEHGSQNRLTRLEPVEAAMELFARCFLPYHIHEAIGESLSFLDQVVKAVPCDRFEFLPEFSAVEHLTSL